MNESEKFLRMFGGIFFAVGVFVGAVGLGIIIIFGEWFGGGIPLLLGICFGGIGGGILAAQFKVDAKRKNIRKTGRRFSGKIYGYIEDKNGTINGDYAVNIKVRYFDEEKIEREAIIPTGFIKGSGEYPIGATIDIYALGTSYSWVEGSVRYEHIEGEDLLMDNKPINTSQLDIIGVECPGCGASFTAARGYTSACPYCMRQINC